MCVCPRVTYTCARAGAWVRCVRCERFTGVPRFAVPMDRLEPRAKWSGGDGPTLEKVGGLGRRAMNDAALEAFRGVWDVTRCLAKAGGSAREGARGGASGAVCAGPVALSLPGAERWDLSQLTQEE